MTAVDRSAVVLYIALAFALSYAGQIAIWIWGGLEGALFGVLAPFLMFTPAIAAAFAVRRERSRFLSILRGPLSVRHMLIGILLPALTALAAAFLINRFYGATPVPFEVEAGRILVPQKSRFIIHGEQGILTYLGNFVGTSVWLSVLAGLLAIGEEVGWRGYLQPRLTDRFGQIGGMLLVGIAWGYWHLPLILQGYVFPDAPHLGAFVLFPLITIALSFFLGWLRHASGSIWPAVLAHGSYNAAFATMVFRMEFGEHTLGPYLIIVALTLATGLLSVVALRS